MLVSFDEIDGELSERRSGGISKGNGDTTRTAAASSWAGGAGVEDVDSGVLLVRRRRRLRGDKNIIRQ